MRPDEFQALLRRRPFRPFRVYLTNGLAYEVRHPELALVERSIVWIHQPDSQSDDSLGERAEFIVLLHIVRGEFLAPPAPASGGNGATTPPQQD